MYRHHKIIVIGCTPAKSQLLLLLLAFLDQLVELFLLVMCEVNAGPGRLIDDRARLRRARTCTRRGVRGRDGGAENSYSDAYGDRRRSNYGYQIHSANAKHQSF